MEYKPGDLLIGITEFLGVLLPGALAAYLLRPRILAILPSFQLAAPTDAAGWVAFAVLAYFLGHLIFLFGSFVDKIYDPLREYIRPRAEDATYNTATAIKDMLLAARSDSVRTTYRFATAYLALRHAPASAEVRQLEADSKFFRSLFLLLLILLAVLCSHLSSLQFWGGAVVTGFCFWRYAERRWKSNERAWELLIVADSLPPLPSPDAT